MIRSKNKSLARKLERAVSRELSGLAELVANVVYSFVECGRKTK